MKVEAYVYPNWKMKLQKFRQFFTEKETIKEVRADVQRNETVVLEIKSINNETVDALKQTMILCKPQPLNWIWFYNISTIVCRVIPKYSYTSEVHTSYEMTDQFLWFQVQMNSSNRNWNTPY